MTGVSCPPPPHRLAGPALRRPVAEGGRWGREGCRPSAWGEAAEQMGGGDGARSRSRITGSGGRAGLRAATGRVANGAGPLKTSGHVKTESTEAVVHLWA